MFQPSSAPRSRDVIVEERFTICLEAPKRIRGPSRYFPNLRVRGMSKVSNLEGKMNKSRFESFSFFPACWDNRLFDKSVYRF